MRRLFDWRLRSGAFRAWGITITLVLLAMPLLAGTASAAAPGTQRFQRTWERPDKPVADLLVSRTWTWGPEANTELMTEPYTEAPGGVRTVQYFDKTRMEDNSYRADGPPWDVTNGLLVVELITGRLQLGDDDFEQREPAVVNVAGDLDDPNGPTYATFGTLLDASPAALNSLYIARVDREGNLTADPSLAAFNVSAAHLDEVTNHAIAAPFWAFMNSTGLVYENGEFSEDTLFPDPVFGTGRPISEAYWAEVLIAGTPLDVLMQCFERRCLTYNPSNPEGWQVEAGNVGIHYYEWRYGTEQDPAPGDPPPGDPPPGDPPPDDPPPGDPPPGDPPPGEPPPDDENTPPAAPTNLSAEGLLDGDVPYIALRWDDQADNEDGFRLYWYPDANNQLVAALAANVEAYEDDSGEPGQLRCYYVEAYNAYGKSEPSNVACAIVPPEPEDLLAPTLISPPNGYVTTDRRVEFHWGLVNGAATYRVCAFELGASCANGTGNYYSSAVLGPTVDIYPLNIPVFMAPDDQATQLYWTAAACDADNNCVWQNNFRSFTIDLRPPVNFGPPALVGEVVDPNDPGRFTFSWELVDGAERYIICVAEPNADCPSETGAWFKSSILGPTVSTHPMDIPLWLAPDGQVTNLNWTVAACNADLNCVWQYSVRSIVVDRS